MARTKLRESLFMKNFLFLSLSSSSAFSAASALNWLGMCVYATTFCVRVDREHNNQQIQAEGKTTSQSKTIAASVGKYV